MSGCVSHPQLGSLDIIITREPISGEKTSALTASFVRIFSKPNQRQTLTLRFRPLDTETRTHFFYTADISTDPTFHGPAANLAISFSHFTKKHRNFPFTKFCFCIQRFKQIQRFCGFFHSKLKPLCCGFV